MESKLEIPMQAFCFEEVDGPTPHDELCRPFVKDRWRYATDQKIIIRVRCDDPDTIPQPKIRGGNHVSPVDVFDRYWKRAIDAAFTPWPSDAPMEQRTADCPNCDYDEFETAYCKEDCSLCKGAGEYVQDFRAKVGMHLIAAKYHALIDTLPNPQRMVDCDPFANLNLHVPLPFIFDGGQGLIMGMGEDC